MTHDPDMSGLKHPLSHNIPEGPDYTFVDLTDHEARAAYLAAPKPEPSPLTAEEVAELDGYGRLFGSMIYPARCIELWEREIMWGRVDGQ